MRRLEITRSHNISPQLQVVVQVESEAVVNAYPASTLMASLPSLALEISNVLNTHPLLKRQRSKRWSVVCGGNVGLATTCPAHMIMNERKSGMGLFIWCETQVNDA